MFVRPKKADRNSAPGNVAVCDVYDDDSNIRLVFLCDFLASSLSFYSQSRTSSAKSDSLPSQN